MFAIIFFVSFFLNSFVHGISSAIPNKLVKCYRANYTNTLLKPPLTVQLLIELIRQIEWDEEDALNLRMFSTSLLHGVRFDGVQATMAVEESEYVVPFRATGKQFYKYKLIVEYLTSGKPQLLPYDSISTRQLCLLHEIISNTVHEWERGNEGRTCPELRSMPYERGNIKQMKLSRCPIESGVVWTRWGTISPGHIVAAIASSLQESPLGLKQLLEVIQQDQNATENNMKYEYDTTNLNNISNVGVSTIIGDLAEVTIQQAFNDPKIGNPGIWNSSYLPRVYYLNEAPFDITSAEILGGIDGLIFAHQIKEWLKILSRTRFSQLLDMYYSNRGIAYDKTYRACDRGLKLASLLNESDLVQQTGNVAKLLQEIGAANQYFSESAIEEYALKVVKEFEAEKDVIITKYNACEQNIDKFQYLEIIAILDEIWKGYETERLVGQLVEVLDVNVYGSTLGLINGLTGDWLTNVTHSLVELYENLRNNNGREQGTFILSRCLETIMVYLQNQTSTNCYSIKKIPRSTVILVMVNSIIKDHDLSTSEWAINSIKSLYPETRIIYITSGYNSERYSNLAKQYANDVLIEISKNGNVVMPRIVKELANVPARLMDFYCNNSHRLEDYITPDIKRIYEINSQYVQRAEFSITVGDYFSSDNGDASICGYNAKTPENKECKGLSSAEEVHFNASKYCVLENISCDVQFSVDITKVKYKCAELDCRYPDQMRLDISTSWSRKSGSSSIPYTIYVAAILVILRISLFS